MPLAEFPIGQFRGHSDSQGQRDIALCITLGEKPQQLIIIAGLLSRTVLFCETLALERNLIFNDRTVTNATAVPKVRRGVVRFAGFNQPQRAGYELGGECQRCVH